MIFFYKTLNCKSPKGPNRFTADPSLPDNRLAQEAINITLYHWWEYLLPHWLEYLVLLVRTASRSSILRTTFVTRGLHGWVVYTIVGLLLALMAHRLCLYIIDIWFIHHSFNGQRGFSLFALLSKKSLSSREGLPLTMKSCFYPLIGDRIFGWPGDLVDILRCSTKVNRLTSQRFIYFLASVWLRLFLACAQVLVLVLCRSTEACIFSTPLYPWILVGGLT